MQKSHFHAHLFRSHTYSTESFHLFHGKFPAPDEGILAGFEVETLKDAGIRIVVKLG